MEKLILFLLFPALLLGQFGRVPTAKFKSVTDTTNIDKRVGRAYVYNDKYWIANGTYLVEIAKNSTFSSKVNKADSTSHAPDNYATRSAFVDDRDLQNSKISNLEQSTLLSSIGNFYSFDNSTSYGTIAYNDSLSFGTTDFSIVALVYCDESGASYIFHAGAGNENVSLSIWSADRVRAYLYDGSNSLALFPDNVFTKNKWQHVALTCDRDGYARIYVEGVVVDSASMASIGNLDNSFSSYIGKTYYGSEGNFSGNIAGLWIYRKCLSTSEVRAHRYGQLPNLSRCVLRLTSSKSSSIWYDEEIDADATMSNATLYEANSMVDMRALDADVIKKDGSVDYTGNQSFGGNYITNSQSIGNIGSGIVGNYYAFDGSSSYGEIADNNNLDFGTGDFSVECFAVLTSSNEYRVLCQKILPYSPYTGFMLRHEANSTLYFTLINEYQTSDNTATTVNTFKDGKLHHIFVSKSGTEFSIYVDGVLQSLSYVYHTYDGATINNNTSYYIGKDRNNVYYSDAQIYMNRLYNTALTATEVKDLYSSAVIPYKYVGASQTALTSGTLTIGYEYIIDTYVSGDDFTNVGGTNASGSVFTAIGTIPTTWTNGSSLRHIGNVLNLNKSKTDTTWYDESGNNLDATMTSTTLIDNNKYGYFERGIKTGGSLEVSGNIVTTGSRTPMMIMEEPTVTNPVFTFVGDEDTGIGRDGANQLSFITNGISRVYLASSGNVGMRTTNPDKTCEINSATGENLRLTYNDADGSATNYADFETTPSGDLTITPSGGDVEIVGDIKQKVYSSNVSNPPTDAELDALFTSPATKGDGWTCYIQDSDTDNFYQVVVSGSYWMIFTGTKAN